MKILYFIIILAGSVSVLFSRPVLFRDVAVNSEKPDKGAYRDFLEFIEKAAAKTKLDKNAEEFSRYLNRSLERFEFSDLYESKYVVKESDHRWSTYSGLNRKEDFLVSLLNIPFDRIPSAAQGDFSAKYTLQERKTSSFSKGVYADSGSYSGSLKLRQNFGKFSAEKIQSIADQLLQVIDIQNMEKLSSPSGNLFANLSGRLDRKILDHLSEDFPKTAKLLGGYFRLEKLFSEYSFQGTNVLRLSIKGQIHLPYIKMDYPELGEYLSGISDLGWIHADILNSSGKKLAEINLDSSRLELFLKVFTDRGAVVPFTGGAGKEELFFKESVQISKLKNIPFFVNISFYGNIYGLRFENPGITAVGSAAVSKGRGELSVQLSQFPRTKVGGGFSYVIPSWLIDLAVPGNMEELIWHFSQVLVHANNEKGTKMYMNLGAEGNFFRLNASADTEFLNNFFVRFALKVWNFKVAPDDEAKEDLKKFIAKIAKTVKEDLARF